MCGFCNIAPPWAKDNKPKQITDIYASHADSQTRVWQVAYLFPSHECHTMIYEKKITRNPLEIISIMKKIPYT